MSPRRPAADVVADLNARFTRFALGTARMAGNAPVFAATSRRVTTNNISAGFVVEDSLKEHPEDDGRRDIGFDGRRFVVLP